MMHTIADLAIILGQSPELSLVVKMSIATALGLAVVRFARGARASVRHLVLASTFAALLALPAAMSIAPAIAIELPWASAMVNDLPFTSSTSSAISASVASVAAPNAASGIDAGATATANGSAARPRTDVNSATRAAEAGSRSGFVIWLSAVGRATGILADANNDGRAAGVNGTAWFQRMPWIATMRAIWLAGGAVILGMLAFGLLRLRGLRRTGLPWMERRDDVMRLAREAGVNRPVTVMMHERVAAPVTCGWRNPVIVFPADAREWSDGDVRRVLLHELEHVRRGDWLVHLAARAICAIYWFHPLVWTAWRRLSLEAERACDDAVVRSEANADSTDYAEQLVLLARRMSTAPAAPMVAMACRSDLSTRVTALLDRHQRRGRAGVMTFVTAASAAAIIVITIGPLRAVAAAATQSSGPVIADGRGSGSGGGAGKGTGHGASSGANAGSGAGASSSAGSGAGSGAGTGSGSGSGANAVIAAPGFAVGGVSASVAGGVPGGITGGAVGGVPGGVAGGAPGAAVGGVSSGVVAGAPGAAVAGGVSDGVIGGVQGAAVGGASGAGVDGVVRSVPGVVVVERQEGADDKRRVTRADRALGEALIEAADDGDVKGIEELLAAGLDVNTKVSGDGSALIAAARKGQYATIKFLLERGADVNMGVEGDGNPLIMAAANGHTAAVTLLLERGANLEAVVDGDENALIKAAERGQLEIVKLLVGKGANVNASVRVESNFNGQPRIEDRTPLSQARRGGHAAVVAFLQSAGAVQ